MRGSRAVRAEQGELYAEWSKRDGQTTIGGPNGPDRHLLYGMLFNSHMAGLASLEGRSIAEELELRGYDLSTLRVSVQRRWPANGKPTA